MFFIDETGFNCSMRRRFGRAQRGERAIVHVPAIRSKNFSLCAVYNISSMFSFAVQRRPYNAEHFLGFVRYTIAKFQEQNIVNAILIMDNVPFHHSRSIRAFVEGAGHQIMFLPPYSPFLNPIENAFNQWKDFVKSSQPSDEAALLSSIEASCHRITPEQCQRYFANMETYIPKCLAREEIYD